MGNFLLKRYFLPCILLLLGSSAMAQTLWSENFNSYANGTSSGTGSGLSPVNWYSSLSGKVNVQGGRIRARDTDAEGIWYTDPINITGFGSLTFSLDVATMADASQFEQGTDYFIGEYRIDGGSWIQFENASGDTSRSIHCCPLIP